MKHSFPLTQFIIDCMKADTMKLRKMNIETTAAHRKLKPEFVRWYRDAELARR
jgi:hypothetical protein